MRKLIIAAILAFSLTILNLASDWDKGYVENDRIYLYDQEIDGPFELISERQLTASERNF